MACQHSYGKYIFPNIISRSFDRNKISAAVLSNRLKDADRCPAAKGLTADDLNKLAKYVEWEKEAATPQ
jgi:hypothetical protein